MATTPSPTSLFSVEQVRITTDGQVLRNHGDVVKMLLQKNFAIVPDSVSDDKALAFAQDMNEALIAWPLEASKPTASRPARKPAPPKAPEGDPGATTPPAEVTPQPTAPPPVIPPAETVPQVPPPVIPPPATVPPPVIPPAQVPPPVIPPPQGSVPPPVAGIPSIPPTGAFESGEDTPL